LSINYDGKVAIVTGAGNGLGKSHAIALAARGCRVVVNDLGGAVDGSGGSVSAAEEVANHINASGGEAIADGANVTKPDEVGRMIAAAMEKWSRVDILVNNAGILRDKTFHKMTLEDFKAVIDVHLTGSAICTHAVWPVMREQNYGRVIFTSSPSGLHGIFGQANYGAAKAGMIGIMNALHLEGAKYNIHVNVLSPSAKTRMTEDLGIPEPVLEQLTPEAITAAMLYLVSDEAPSRAIVSCAGGGYARAYMVETDGVFLPPDAQTPEEISRRWDQISSKDNVHYYDNSSGPIANFMAKAQKH
jgi:NAD(P)-dependent dehydrogenase (short-subunit alcohol dehydrogenase family)